MTLTAADIRGHNGGAAAVAALQTTQVTLSPVGKKSEVILFTASRSPIEAPSFYQISSIGGGNVTIRQWARPDCPEGESSWQIGGLGGTAADIAWIAIEMNNIDLISPAAAWGASSGLSGTASTGTSSPSVSDPDICCLAAWATAQLADVDISSSPSNGFTELRQAQLTSGDWPTLSLAYLFPGTTGTFESSVALSPGSPSWVGTIGVHRARPQLPNLQPAVISS